MEAASPVLGLVSLPRQPRRNPHLLLIRRTARLPTTTTRALQEAASSVLGLVSLPRQPRRNTHLLLIRRTTRLPTTTTRALQEAPAAATSVEITWQIIVGSIAGITPFLVAAVEFSKRIAAQRKCKVCSGSGLVRKDKHYARCPGCGGFLPWQSWKRFFTG